MTNGMKTEIPKHLPPQALQGAQAAELSDGSGVGAVLDPNTLGQLPEAVATGIREGLAAAMHPVFVAGLPIIAIAFVATLFIKELPLRTVAFADIESDAEGAATELVDAESERKEALLRSGIAGSTSPGSWRAGGGALPSCCGPLRSLWDVTTKSRRASGHSGPTKRFLSR
jgi:hypothetical protein